VVLTATNTYAGATLIAAGGTLQVGSALGLNGLPGTLGTGPVTDNGVLAYQLSGVVTLTNTVTGGGGLTQTGPGTLILPGGNIQYTGPTVISGGTLQVGDGAAAGTLGAGNGPVTDNGVLAFDRSDSGLVVTSVISGGGGVTQMGSGATTLDAVNTYTGLTEVSSGTLIIGDASTPTAAVAGPVQVDAGGSLSGYGSIGGSLLNNGFFSPSNMAVGGTFTQGPGGTLLVAVTPVAATLLTVAGAASLGGTVTFAYAPGTYSPTTYTFLTSSGLGGTTFSTVSGLSGISCASGMIGKTEVIPHACTRHDETDTGAAGSAFGWRGCEDGVREERAVR
jgi:autotransporter-associated beta strand protein